MHPLLTAALSPQGRDELLRWDRKLSTRDPLGPRLLPYLYHRYRNVDLPGPLRELLAASYRRALLQGQARRCQCWQLLAQPLFGQRDWMLLKGVAMAEGYYENWALRPMGDLDLLVEGRERELWLAGLLAQDWSLHEHHGHASSLIHSNGLALDIHDFALSECRWKGVDDDFWQHARPFVDFARGQMPGPEHLLLHLCLHGSKTDGQSSPWLLDAMILLQKERALNWDLFWESARRRRLGVAAAEALVPLTAYVDMPELPRGGRLMDRLYARVRRWPESRGRHLLWDAFEHFRNVPGAGARSYLHHLGQRWGASSAWQFPLALCFRALRELSHGPNSRPTRSGPDWSEPEQLALTCCLGRQTPEVWEDWLRQYPGVRRLSGYLGSHCSEPPQVLQLAQIYEERRWRLVAERTAEVLTALKGLEPRLPRGPALAERYYSEPWQRHCHGLDLLLSLAARREAEQRLCRLGYSVAGSLWRHPGGFEVNLHEQLLPEALDFDDDRWVESTICGVEVRVLEGAELMALLLAHGALQKVPLSWGLDLALVIQRHRPLWMLVAPLLEQRGLALVCASLWDGLPESVSGNLELKRPPVPSQREWEVLFRAERRRGFSRRHLWGRLGQWEARGRFLWWLLQGLVRRKDIIQQ